MNTKLSMSQPALYQIYVQGYLVDRWGGLFEGMTLVGEASRGTTMLTGVVPDQAALHGILARIRDLGLPLLDLTCITDEQQPNVGAEGPAAFVTDSGGTSSAIT